MLKSVQIVATSLSDWLAKMHSLDIQNTKNGSLVRRHSATELEDDKKASLSKSITKSALFQFLQEPRDYSPCRTWGILYFLIFLN